MQRLVECEVDHDRRARRCIDDDELVAVARLAKRCEKHYRCPQDVEWAIDADLPDGENVLLLQSRPETVHSNVVASVPPTAPAATPAFSLGSITSSLLGGRGAPA